jgi:hypothetical protein
MTLTVSVACAPARAPWSTHDPARLTLSSPAMTVDQLRKFSGMTVLGALGTMPAYFATLSHSPQPHFTLVLDGTRSVDLEFLKSIRATDVYEIRINRASEASFGSGGPEVIVTTLAGRNRAH